MSKYVSSFAVLLSLLVFSLDAQEYVFDYDYINTDEGLPSNEVYNIIQDNKGYLWINTPGTISRYDGYTFKTYSNTLLRIGVNAALTLAFDQAGNLWYNDQDTAPSFCGILNPTTDSLYTIEAYTKGQLTSKDITAITPSAAKAGTVCMVTNKGQVFEFDQALKKVFQDPRGLSFLSGHQMKDGSYWLLDEGQAVHVTPTTAKNNIERYSLPFEPLQLISHTPNVIIEIQEIPPRYVQLQKIAEKEAFSPFIPTLKSVQESIKILAANNYQLLYSPHQLQLSYKTSEYLTSPNSLISPCDNCRLEINKAITDVQDNLWLGTTEGLIKFTPIKKDYSILESGKGIESIYQWDQTLWLGEVAQNTRLNLNTSSRRSFLKKERVKAAAYAKDNNDQLWLAAGKHIYAYNQAGKRIKAHALKGNNARTIHFQEAYNQLLIGTSLGLEQLDIEADTFKIIRTPLDSTSLEIRHIYQGNSGLGVVTDTGLFILNPSTLEQQIHYSVEKGLPTNDLLYAYEDKEDHLWIATKGKGVIKWQTTTNKTAQLSTENGLSANTVFAIYEDEFNHLWLPSQNGLNCLDKATNHISIYNSSDNIKFKPFAHHQATDGTLYFGGENGIIKRHAKDLFVKDSTSSPFRLVKVLVAPKDSEKYVDRTTTVFTDKEIVVTPSDEITEIYFNLMDFRNLDANEYKYRIEGYRDQWIPIKENKVTLMNPPYGKYNLQIQAKGSNGVWTQQMIELPIIVETPFYRQWWFQFLVLSLGGIIIYLGSRLRIQALEKDKERLETEVLRRTKQIEKDTETIAAQAEGLKALDKAKTRFFSNITHELRTPLTLIMGRTEQLLDSSTAALDDQKLNSIQGSANNLLGLINQLLDLSKLEGGQMKIDAYHGDLIGYTEELVYRFKPLATQKNLQLEQTSRRKVWKTYFDKEKWDRIIINLMSNAIKFTPEGGTVHVHIKSTKINEKNHISLAVKDTGLGIEKEQLNKIFERFHQVDGSYTKIQQGTGIGLSLVKELVDLQGGQLTASSELNKGTTFSVNLPILTATENAKKLELSTTLIPIILESELAHKASKSKKKKKDNYLDCLIIEDNHEMRNYISQCIDPTKYNIIEAVDGEEGIQKALAYIPDLIVSDVMMPKKNGFEVTQALRNHISTSHIPIVLLTAKASLSSKLEGLKRGADAYLTKPFSPEELVIRVNKLIELRQKIQSRYNAHQLTPTPDTSTTNVKEYKKEDEFVSELKEYILANLQETQLNGDMIGKHLGFSRMQLHRKLKALLKLPIGEIIRNIRVEKAIQLLKEQELNISEIAYATGFSSPSTFSRIFKDKQGVSPSEYRGKHAQST